MSSSLTVAQYLNDWLTGRRARGKFLFSLVLFMLRLAVMQAGLQMVGSRV